MFLEQKKGLYNCADENVEDVHGENHADDVQGTLNHHDPNCTNENTVEPVHQGMVTIPNVSSFCVDPL